MNNKFKVLTILLILLCLLVGCSQENTSQDSDEEEASNVSFSPRLATDEEVTINIVGLLNNFESLEAVISDFAVYYPNCEVLYSSYSGTDLETKLRGDDTVNIFLLRDSNYQNDYIKSVCLDLSSEDIDLSAIREDNLKSSTVEGVLFGLPVAQTCDGLIVNKTLLEELNLEIPTNYSEFLKVCASLKENGYTPIQGYGYNQNIIRAYIYTNLCNLENEDEVISSLELGEEGSSKSISDAWAIVDELVKNGYIDINVNATYTDSYNDAILKFFEGDVPFLTATTETFSGMKKRETKSEHFGNEPFEYVFISSPVGEDSAYTYLENWYEFAINKNCENIDWAIEFIRFLATQEEIDKLSNIKGLPSVAINTSDARFEEIYAVREDCFKVNDRFISVNVDTAIYDMVERIVNQEIELEDAEEAFEAKIRELNAS